MSSLLSPIPYCLSHSTIKKIKPSKTNPKKIESLIEETPMYLSSVWMVAG
jgi:hypothetical protein